MSASDQLAFINSDQKRYKFGVRCLSNTSDVYSHNAWDDVEWSEEMEDEASKLIADNTKDKLSLKVQEHYESGASEYWDKFYNQHDNKFFKDRSWLTIEFPELFSDTNETITILEVGCGVGNTTFPILRATRNTFVYTSDFSQKAVGLLKSVEYDSSRCQAFVFDVTKTDTELPFPSNSLDFVVMIFVLSAISPALFESVLRNIIAYLKPGGMLLFRDYGRYDMAQLRFKKGKCLTENFYLRADGTRVYFFEQKELKQLFESVGLIEVQNKVDRRLLVNRKRKLKMYRVWIQCKYMRR
ncbi:Methyltransferase protein 2-A isoform X2 [Paragonimus heterotremus]|uniref:tRNA N(3)-methylcytidine methyltransferase n=1 Tax=Paragonimus heterotremus TaxID=100268 RepID=A0A8J4TI86_9TREM|nr:Methyltransferase protein 2-A isoform X2 [Paragonimus heterotremus]